LAFDEEVRRARGNRAVTNFAIDPATGRPNPAVRARVMLKTGTSSIVVPIPPGQTSEEAIAAFLSMQAKSAPPARSRAPPSASSAPAVQTKTPQTIVGVPFVPRFFASEEALAVAHEPVKAEGRNHGVIGIYRRRTDPSPDTPVAAAEAAPSGESPSPVAHALVAVVRIPTEEVHRQILVVAEYADASPSNILRAAASVDCWNFALYGPLTPPSASVAPSPHPHPGLNFPTARPRAMSQADWLRANLRAPLLAPFQVPQQTWRQASPAPRQVSPAPRQAAPAPRPAAAKASAQRQTATTLFHGFTMIQHANRMRDTPSEYAGLEPLARVKLHSSTEPVAPCRHIVCMTRSQGKDFFRDWAKVVGPAVAGPTNSAGMHRFVGLVNHIWRHEMSLLPHGCDRSACAVCMAVESRGLDLTSVERRPNLIRPAPAAGADLTSVPPAPAASAASPLVHASGSDATSGSSDAAAAPAPAPAGTGDQASADASGDGSVFL
jgi:hypothetical protein